MELSYNLMKWTSLELLMQCQICEQVISDIYSYIPQTHNSIYQFIIFKIQTTLGWVDGEGGMFEEAGASEMLPCCSVVQHLEDVFLIL